MKILAPLHSIWLCQVLIACHPANPPNAAKGGSGTALPDEQIKDVLTPVSDVARIVGDWDVARFEGYEPKRLSGTVRAAFADFSERGVRLRIECNYSGRIGTVRDGHFTTTSNEMSGQTQMGCGPEREARDSRYFSFFDKVPLIELDGTDRLRLTAGGSELILERPAVRRLSFTPTGAEIQGSWKMIEVTRYLPQGGYEGIGLSEVPGKIIISGNRLYFSKCPQYAITFRVRKSSRLENITAADLAISPEDCLELKDPALGPDMPTLLDAMRVLHAEPMIELSGKDSLLFSTDQLGVLIVRDP